MEVDESPNWITCNTVDYGVVARVRVLREQKAALKPMA